MRLQSRNCVAAAICSLGLLLSGAHARAGEARCIWERFPEAKRADILTHEADSVADATRADITDEEYVAALSGCAVTLQTAKAAGSALNAYALQLKTQQTLLSGDAALTPDRLDAAWNALDETLRARLARHVSDDAVEPGAPLEAAQAFLDGLGLAGQRPSGEGVALSTYVLARAARAVFESQF